MTWRTNDETSFWRVNRHDALECLSATFRTHVFPPHTHESYVIGAVVGGVNVYRISGSLLRAGPGELCFVHPGEVHDAVPEGDGYSYRMIYPKPSLLQNIVEMATGRRANAPQFNGPVIRDELLAARYLRAHEALEAGAEPLGVDEALTSVLLDAQRLRPCFKRLMGPQVAGGKLLVPDDRAIELRDICPPAGCHFHDVLQQRRLGINHPVAVAVAFRHRVMNLGGMDEAQFARPRPQQRATDPVNIHAANHRADHIAFMSMGWKYMGAERGRQAFQGIMPVHPPE